LFAVAVSAVPHVHSTLKRAARRAAAEAEAETELEVGVMPASYIQANAAACAIVGAAPTGPDTCVEDALWLPVTQLRNAMAAALAAGTPEGTILSKVIADILLVTPKMISYRPFQAGIGSTCIPRYNAAHAFQGYIITFEGIANANMMNNAFNPNGIQNADVIKTAQVMHELTHCRLMDAYGAYMVSYKANPFPAVAAPGVADLSANGCWLPGREAHFQGQFASVAYNNILLANAQALSALSPPNWNNRPVLTKNLISSKVAYIVAQAAAGLEYDAPLAQLLYLCFSYPRCRAKTAFYRKIAAMNEECICRRHLNNGQPKAALAAPTPRQDCTGY